MTLVALVYKESRWKPQAKSPTNDYGLGQIHCPGPYCARQPTVEQLARLFDPCSNLELTAKMIRDKGLKRYNPGNPSYAERVQAVVRRLAFVPLPAEG